MSALDETQHQGYPSEFYNSMFGMGNQYDNRVGLVKELSPAEEINKIMDEFRGIIKDESGKEINKIVPIMNELGISRFYHIVTSTANSITTFSNYRTDDKLIYRITNKFIKDGWMEFGLNLKEKDIAHLGVSRIIMNRAASLILSALFKALGAGDRGAATKAVQETIQRQFTDSSGRDDQLPKRKGFMSAFLPGGIK